MRVVFNQLPALTTRSGVGHYTTQLLEHLRADDNLVVDAFPGPALSLGYRAFSVLSRYVEILQESSRKWWSKSLLAACGLLPGLAFERAIRLARGGVRRRFRSMCRLRGYDLYHEPNFIPLETDVPTVVTVHDLSVLLYPEWHPPRRVQRFETDFLRGLRRCRHILTDSEFIRRQLIRTLHISPDRVSTACLGVRPQYRPLSATATAVGLRRLGLESNYLLYVGTIEPRKNLLMLMQAYCALPPTIRRKSPLLLVGRWGWKTGLEREYYQAVGRHRGVRHVGYVRDDQLPALYNGARALVYPSFYEGFGLPPLEMMATGGAVLTSTAGALVEVVGRCAGRIEAEDTGGWHDALARVIADDDWVRRLRCGATELARRYTWQRCAEATLSAYRSVCGMDVAVEPALCAA
jgi:alpha-1,3-rhamnosyl/mannosyltransferase